MVGFGPNHVLSDFIFEDFHWLVTEWKQDSSVIGEKYLFQCVIVHKNIPYVQVETCDFPLRRSLTCLYFIYAATHSVNLESSWTQTHRHLLADVALGMLCDRDQLHTWSSVVDHNRCFVISGLSWKIVKHISVKPKFRHEDTSSNMWPSCFYSCFHLFDPLFLFSAPIKPSGAFSWVFIEYSIIKSFSYM